MENGIPEDDDVVIGLDVEIIDLRGRCPDPPPEGIDLTDVVRWLRTSGGALRERQMKCAAADFIEAHAEIGSLA